VRSRRRTSRRAITSIHRTTYAVELNSVDTVVRDGLVASLLRFDVPAAEQLVFESGDPGAVIRLYEATEGSLEPALCAAVERTTSRTVLAFQSSMSPQHGVILEAFVLA